VSRKCFLEKSCRANLATHGLLIEDMRQKVKNDKKSFLFHFQLKVDASKL